MPTSFQVESKDWTGKSAVLLVHGVGNAKPGDYGDLVQEVRSLLGDKESEFAIYRLMYDGLHDWFAEKTQLADQLGPLLGAIGGRISATSIADTISEVVGDVLWPVLSSSARSVIREAYLAQLKQIVLDGNRCAVPTRRQKLHIICHSLGCFHTYEALHAAAAFPSHRLTPTEDAVRFQNVIFMASPVQLIRTLAGSMGATLPKRWLATLDSSGLSVPSRLRSSSNRRIKSVAQVVSMVGELDPVGGYFFRDRGDWAYMKLPGQVEIVDPQTILEIDTEVKLKDVLKSGLRSRSRPVLTVENPHSWMGYITRHRGEINQWLLA